MKSKSKFAYLLSAGGSLLSKENLSRRLHLPQKKESSQKRASAGSTGRLGSDTEPLESEMQARQRKPRQRKSEEEKLPTLTWMVERIVRESRGEGKARNL